MGRALREHWPEYLMEAAGLGLFMVSAGVFGTLLEYPGSGVHRALPDPAVRRILMGAAMGLTAVAIIYSPWGKRSGAHINPAFTLTFWRLGKVRGPDATFYMAAQFAGAVAGVLLVQAALGAAFAEPPVRFVATLPIGGVAAAWLAELVISALLMTAVLIFTNAARLNRYTGLLAGALVATYIAVESPISGMSINPARTFGSALPAQLWTGVWIYFTAPPLGMLVAAEAFGLLRGRAAVKCAKYHHDNEQRCIFRCGYAAERAAATAAPVRDAAVRSIA